MRGAPLAVCSACRAQRIEPHRIRHKITRAESQRYQARNPSQPTGLLRLSEQPAARP